MLQAELRPERPWAVKHSAGDLAARLVAHLQAQLNVEESPVEPLARAWKVFRGIETGADAYSQRIQKRLPADVRRGLEMAGARTGDAILELPAGREKVPPWKRYPDLLAKSPEAQAILYAAIDDADYTSLIVPRSEPPAEILAALERWRPVLATRAEIARNPRRRWWEAAWPRPTLDMSSAKVIALYRTHRGRFALDESGEWRPSTKLTLAVGREAGAPVAYLCGLLNSELLDLWYAVRGKTPRDIWRNYEPKRMNEMPYRRPEGDPRADRVADVVRQIAANRRALLPHRPVVRDLTRIVKDPWKDGPVVVDRAKFVGELPASETVSVRLDPKLEISFSDATGRPERESAGVLAFRRGKNEVGRVTGDAARLDLLEESLGGKVRDDVSEILLPIDLDRFERKVGDREKLVAKLLAEGRRLVEEVERLVCALYGLPDELTDEVVEHAVARAVRSVS